MKKSSFRANLHNLHKVNKDEFCEISTDWYIPGRQALSLE